MFHRYKMIITDTLLVIRIVMSTITQFIFIACIGGEVQDHYLSGILYGIVIGIYIWASFYWVTRAIIASFAYLSGCYFTNQGQYATLILLVLIIVVFREKDYRDRTSFFRCITQKQKVEACVNILNHSIGQSIVVLGQQYKVLFINDIFKNTFQLNDDFHLDDHILDIVSRNHILHDEIDSYMTDNNTERLITQISQAQSTSVRQIQITIQNIKRSFDAYVSSCQWNNQASTILILRDITDKELREIYENQNNYKDKLLQTISHDLKTPLNGIELLSFTLSQQNKQQPHPDEQLINGLDYIRSNSQLLLSFICDIVDFSQIQQGQLKLKLEIFSLDKLIEELLSIFKPQAEIKGLQLVTKFENNQELNSDYDRLKQVLINLVRNALKFTFEGQISITIQEYNQDQLLIVVQDTGVGLDDELLRYLFVPKIISQNNQHGAGISLQITKKLIGLLGPTDTLEIKSKINEGSIFSFIINKSLNDHSNTNLDEGLKQSIRVIKSPSIFVMSRQNTSQLIKLPPRILIVDDTPINLIALQLMINHIQQSLQIDLAYNGLQAVQLVEQTKYDIIFMDINMPVMDGLQATKLIREYESTITSIYSQLLEKNQEFLSDKDISQAKQIGADQYIVKPPKPNQIKGVLRDYNII
ncbi:hypothetical protein pb186bvf_000165 [Paramecium bursaria]